MKSHILLLAAAYLNGGAYVDAGVSVRVGAAKNEITEERAAEIVRMRRAEEVDGADDEAGDDSDVDDGLGSETVPELKKIAAEAQIDLGAAKTKPEILKVIRAHRASAASQG